MDIVFSSTTQLVAAIRAKRVSAVEALEAHLEQIEKHNPALHAVVTLAAEQARERARQADETLAQGEVWGPLHGVPVTIKFKVDRVDRILPATNEYLVQMFGMQDEAQLREETKKSAEGQLRVRQQTVLRAQVSKHLLEKIKIDLPERLTANQAARTLERRRMELMYRGISPQDIEMHGLVVRIFDVTIHDR